MLGQVLVAFFFTLIIYLHHVRLLFWALKQLLNMVHVNDCMAFSNAVFSFLVDLEHGIIKLDGITFTSLSLISGYFFFGPRPTS
jgi:hypothetical protein